MSRACASAIFALALWVSAGPAAAQADRGTPGPTRVATTRVRLDCILRDRQRRQAEALAERQRVQDHLRQVETFRGSLDPTRNAESMARADQALAQTRQALAAIDARLEELARAIAQAQRAITNLQAPPRARPLAEELRRSANVALANAMHCGVREDESPVGDFSLRVRLIAGDLCGERTDAHFINESGLSTDPRLQQRLDGILSRLDAAGGGAGIMVRILAGCPDEGGGAFSTSRTAFIGECELSRDRTDDEIAFVVAHERAHVALQHLSLTYIRETLDRWANGERPEGVDVETADPRLLATSLAARLGDFGRDQEFEADLVGAANAMAAGFSPAGIGRFLDRIQANAFLREVRRRARQSDAARARDPGDIAGREARRLAASHPSPLDRRQAMAAAFGERFWELDPAAARCSS